MSDRPATATSTWAISVQDWDGACFHERIVGPFDSEEAAESWASGRTDQIMDVFDLMPPDEADGLYRRADNGRTEEEEA